MNVLGHLGSSEQHGASLPGVAHGLLDVLEGLLVLLGLEHVALEELEQHDAGAPGVGLEVVGKAVHHLGGCGVLSCEVLRGRRSRVWDLLGAFQ